MRRCVLRSSPRRSPVFIDSSTAGVRWSPKWGRGGSKSRSRSCRHAFAVSRALRISLSRARRTSRSRVSSAWSRKRTFGRRSIRGLSTLRTGFSLRWPSFTARESTLESVKRSAAMSWPCSHCWNVGFSMTRCALR